MVIVFTPFSVYFASINDPHVGIYFDVMSERFECLLIGSLRGVMGGWLFYHEKKCHLVNKKMVTTQVHF